MGTALLTTSLGLWALALLVGSIDGIYFHLWRFRLFRTPGARLEHVAHTLRAALLVPTLWVGLLGNTPARGKLLLALIFADWSAAIWDVYLERQSRRSLGGIPHVEYFIHLAATAFHSAAEAVTVAALIAFGWTTAPSLPVRLVVWPMILLSLVALLLHLVLMHPRFSRSL